MWWNSDCASAKNFVTKIASSVKRLDSLIDDILVLTKTGVESIAVKEVFLNEILDNVKGELKEQIEILGAAISISAENYGNARRFIAAESKPGEGSVFTCYFPV